ncbi:D-alanyl-D-alaninecarboxypeptidase/D-alanyl-D-al anine-endopeptidase [Janibacter hoylei PVAS-1]|uniref:D-alanyl-D-alaninecarboxypeptidase/D-alanyl-D-al anine-endopeptidase n=1 Tax=Janibacter hoylei PVAS-1 TaxID=1210046 RepID=K1ERP3_9MICO|nr:hypothetical protein [Janibacter hoylei]EKA61858.1 D-alanyl-D-alaninecarboxypeptidase/D-alanyl-D-al anine-endopeptidase [Janibacter hoylei PVAS-1]
MRRALVAVTTVAALAVGYGVADAYDRVPGVLTIDEAASEQPPEPVEPTPVLPPADESAPLPTAAGLRDAIADDVGSSALGPRVGIVVRDAVTGDPVWTKGADRPPDPGLHRQAAHRGRRRRAHRSEPDDEDDRRRRRGRPRARRRRRHDARPRRR